MRTDDLNQIKQNSYHQTLFEMLGVFSLGGNFKQETIPYFWEFFTATNWLGLNPQRLFITVYRADKVTEQLWREQKGIIPEQILSGSEKTNLWDMGGENSPWGYNSEIYYDLAPGQSVVRAAEDLDNQRFLEICNIVFPEFYHHGSNNLALPEKCVDVGAGLERIAMVIQEKKNTFEIDLWTPIIQLMEKTTQEKLTYA